MTSVMSNLADKFPRIAISDRGFLSEGKFRSQDISPSEDQTRSDDEPLSSDEALTDDEVLWEDESLLVAANPGFFSKHSHIKRAYIAKTVKLIGRDLSKKDIKPGNYGQPAVPVLGIVYVAKETNTRFVKVGFSTNLDETRVKDITTRCGIPIEKWYLTRPFHCAYRTEQIVHRILHHWANYRHDCKCGKKNCEWYKKGFGDIIELVNLVHTWMVQRPYDRRTTKLRYDWERALRIWDTSQDALQPLSMSEFFLMGLELRPPLKILPVYSPLGQTSKSASTNPLSSRILSSPGPQARSVMKHFRFRPRWLFHANSSPAGLPSESPPVHYASPSVTRSPERPIPSPAEMTPSKMTSRTVLDASALVTPVRHISSIDYPAPGSKPAGEQILANDPEEVLQSNDDGAFCALVKSMEKYAISTEDALTGSDVTAKPDPTREDYSITEEKQIIEERPRAENVPMAEEITTTKKLPRTRIDPAAKDDVTEEGDPREDEATITTSESTESEGIVDDEDSADDEDSDDQPASAIDEESEDDTEQNEVKLARARSELAEECRELAIEEQLFASGGDDYLARLRKDLIVKDPSLPDESESSSEDDEMGMEEEQEEEEEEEKKEEEKNEEGKEKKEEKEKEEEEEKEEGKKWEDLPSPDSTMEGQTKVLLWEPEVGRVAEPDIKLESDLQDEPTADVFTREECPEALSTSMPATNKSDAEDCGEVEEDEDSRLGPSMTRKERARHGGNNGDQVVVLVSDDVRVSVGQGFAIYGETSAPTRSAAANSALNQAVPPSQGEINAQFQPAIKTEANGAKLRCQSTTFQQTYHEYSSKEMRLADYGTGRRFGNGSIGTDTFGASKFRPFGASIDIGFGKTDSDIFGATSWSSTPFGETQQGELGSGGTSREKPTKGSFDSQSTSAQVLFTEKASRIFTDTDYQNALDAWQLFCLGNREDVSVSNSGSQSHSSQSLTTSASTTGAGNRCKRIPPQEAAKKEGLKVSLQNSNTLQPDTPPIEPLRFRCLQCRYFSRNIISSEEEKILRSGGELSSPPQCVMCRSSCLLFRYLSQDTDPQVTRPYQENHRIFYPHGRQQESANPYDRFGDISGTLALVGPQDTAPTFTAREKAETVLEQASSHVAQSPPMYSFGQNSAEPNLREFTWLDWTKTDWTSVFGGAPARSQMVNPERKGIKARNPAVIKISKAGKKIVVRLPPTD